MQQSDAKFYQRFWEMYFGCVLLEQGLSLKKPPKDGPDICIQHGAQRIWIEAVAPERGETGNPNSVLEMEYEELRFDPDTGQPLPLEGAGYVLEEDKVKLRYLHAISIKSDKVQGYIRKGIISPSDPVIIALNSANIEEDSDSGSMDIIKKICFGVGREQIEIRLNRETNKVEASAHYELAPTVRKISSETSSEIAIQSAIFLKDIYPHISAILFSYARLGRNPFNGELHLIYNRFAKNPLQRHFLPNVKEC
jgi:hypothetical protein